MNSVSGYCHKQYPFCFFQSWTWLFDRSCYNLAYAHYRHGRLNVHDILYAYSVVRVLSSCHFILVWTIRRAGLLVFCTLYSITFMSSILHLGSLCCAISLGGLQMKYEFFQKALLLLHASPFHVHDVLSSCHQHHER
jgi:hypothetical protein